MIKDVMVTLEGTAADETRLAAVEVIAGLFQSQVIGLYPALVKFKFGR
jgi:hypothetical protein